MVPPSLLCMSTAQMIASRPPRFINVTPAYFQYEGTRQFDAQALLQPKKEAWEDVENSEGSYDPINQGIGGSDESAHEHHNLAYRHKKTTVIKLYHST